MSSKKRLASTSEESQSKKFKEEKEDESFDIKNVSDALLFIKSLCSSDQMDKMPPIIWKHQLYALIDNRTKVDKELNLLCQQGKLRQIKLGSTLSENETAIVTMNDYQDHVNACCPQTIVIKRFLDKVVKDNSCSSFTNKQLKEKFQFNDENIKELIRNGLLVSHYINVGSYLLSIPNAGEFVKSFNIGKKAVISMIKRSKFQEIAKQEIMKRKLPKESKFSIKFHIYDLIGSNHIKCINSSMGIVYRLN